MGSGRRLRRRAFWAACANVVARAKMDTCRTDAGNGDLPKANDECNAARPMAYTSYASSAWRRGHCARRRTDHPAPSRRRRLLLERRQFQRSASMLLPGGGGGLTGGEDSSASSIWWFLLRHARALVGATLAELADGLGLPCPGATRTKGWSGQVIDASSAWAGATAPDFAALGVELKSVPVADGLEPLESTAVCNIDPVAIAGESGPRATCAPSWPRCCSWPCTCRRAPVRWASANPAGPRWMTR